MSSLFEVSDTWMVISIYLTPSSIASLSCTCSEANTVINHPVVWEQQCARFYHTEPDNTDSPQVIDYKDRIRKFIEKYGPHCIWYYHRVRRCWTALQKWSEEHLPELLDTFNPPATDQQIADFKKTLFGDEGHESLTAYLLFLGECANGQRFDAQYPTMGLFGFYSFNNKRSTGRLLSTEDATRFTEQVHSLYANDFDSVNRRHDATSSNHGLNPKLKNLWLYTAGLPTADGQISIPCLTLLDRVSGRIFKILQNCTCWHPGHGNATSFLDHLEWYINNTFFKYNMFKHIWFNQSKFCHFLYIIRMHRI